MELGHGQRWLLVVTTRRFSFSTLGGFVEVAGKQRHAFPDTQDADQHEKVDEYGTAGDTAALEVHVQEGRELAAAFNQTSTTSFCNKAFQIPIGTGVFAISGSKVFSLKRIAQCRKSGSEAHSRK